VDVLSDREGKKHGRTNHKPDGLGEVSFDSVGGAASEGEASRYSPLFAFKL
jgi:hypothetical protein